MLTKCTEVKWTLGNCQMVTGHDVGVGFGAGAGAGAGGFSSTDNLGLMIETAVQNKRMHC